MRESDIENFTAMLDSVCSMLSRGAYVPTTANAAMFFRALARFEIDQVRAAFDAHVADPVRGRFVPVPADLIAQIEQQVADDGRPTPDEAWLIAVRALDETDTVVWTEETSAAWYLARPVLDLGDEVGARMGFRQAYERLVDAARRERHRPVWNVSVGFDGDRRAQALAGAVKLGQISQTEMLAIEGDELDVLMLGTDVPSRGNAARQKLADVAEALRRREPVVSADAAARARTAELQAETAAKVASYGGVQ